MNKIKKSLGPLNKKQRRVAIEKIVDYFATERDEEIGVIAAEDILDMFLEEISPDIFNSGVKEAKTAVENSFESLKMDIELSLKESKVNQ